jgi:hypothetical protein
MLQRQRQRQRRLSQNLSLGAWSKTKDKDKSDKEQALQQIQGLAAIVSAYFPFLDRFTKQQQQQ